MSGTAPDWIAILTRCVLLLSLMGALAAMNRSERERFRQWPVPLLAIGYGLLVTLLLGVLRAQYLPWAFSREALLGLLLPASTTNPAPSPDDPWSETNPIEVPELPAQDLVQQGLQWAIQWLADEPLVETLNLLVLGGFVLIKAGWRIPGWIRGGIDAGTRLLSRGDSRDTPAAGRAEVARLREARNFYRFVPGQGIVLRDEWHGIRWLLVVLGSLSVVWLLGTSVAERIEAHQMLALLPTLPVLILLESAWYLGGPLRTVRRPSLRVEDEQPRVTGRYRALWDEYRKRWPDSWLVALAPPSVTDTTRRHAVEEFRKRLLAGEDLLAPALEREAAEDALLAHALRVTTRGKDVMFLLPGHGEHEVVRAWLEGCLRDRALSAVIPVQRNGKAGPDLSGLDKDARRWVRRWHLATPEDILGPSGVTSLRNVGLIIATNIGDAMSEPLPLMRAITRVVAVTGQAAPQIVMLGEPREYLRDAIRRNFPAKPTEIRPTRLHASETYAIVWPTDAPLWYQSEIFKAHTPNFIGEESMLSALAWARGAHTVRLGDQSGTVWRHSMETLQNHRGFLGDGLLGIPFVTQPREVLSDQIDALIRDRDVSDTRHGLFSQSADSWFSPRDTRSVLLVRDVAHNLPVTLEKWSDRADQSLLLHIVSPPHMLREYFADLIDHFFHSPVLPLSPKLQAEEGTAWVLAERMRTSTDLPDDEAPSRREGLDERDLRRALERLPSPPDDPTKALRSMLETNVIERPAGATAPRLIVDVRPEFVRSPEDQRVRVEPVRRFRLRKDMRFRTGQDSWDIVDENGRPLTRCRAATAVQRYQPGQLHGFDGHAYRILRHEPDQRRSIAAPATPRAEPCYRSHLRIRLRQSLSDRRKLALDEDRNWQNWGACRLAQDAIVGLLRVKPLGYYRFDDGIVRNSRFGAQYYALTPGRDGVRVRRHRTPAIWRFEFKSDGRDGQPDPCRSVGAEDRSYTSRLNDWSKAPQISWTLAFLIQEMLPTLLPGAENSVFCLSDRGAPTPDASGDDYLQRLDFRTSGETARWKHSKRDRVVIHFVEDSASHLGLAQALKEDWPVVFGLLHDYLCWLLERMPPESDAKARTGDPEPVRFRFHGAHRFKPYLGFGCDAPAGELALEDTLAFLEALGLGLEDRQNSHRALRKRFLERVAQAEQALKEESAATDADADAAAADTAPAEPDLACHFCGRTDSADYVVLSGGRYRCARCSLSALDTESSIRKAETLARDLFTRATGITPAEIPVEFQENGLPASRDDANWTWEREGNFGSSGTARSSLTRKDGDLRILVETGLPHALVVFELIRQMAHAWILEHVDQESMRASIGARGGNRMAGGSSGQADRLVDGVAATLSLHALRDAGLLPALDASKSGALGSDEGLKLVEALCQRTAPDAFAEFQDRLRGRWSVDLLETLEQVWPKVE